MAWPNKTKQNEKAKAKEIICFDDSVVKNLPIQETQATWVQSLAWEDALQKGMATESSVLAWEVPWTEKPGRLQSWDLQESDMTVQLSTSMCICMCVCVYTCVCVYKVELNLFALSLVSSEGFH